MVALFATTGEIPERAAKLLDYQGEAQVLATLVTATPAPDTGTLTLTTTDPDGETAAKRVNAFAEATIAFFRDEQSRQAQAQIAELTTQLDRTRQQLQAAQAQLDRAPADPVLQAKVDALQVQYSTQFGQVTSLQQQSGTSDLLSILQKGVPIPQATQTFTAPSNPVSRLAIAGVLGLLLGAALALVVERLDSRMRTREQVEDAIGLPVLAEIPVMPKSYRTKVVSALRPASVVAEAFRALRSSVLLAHPGPGRAPSRAGRPSSSLVILVTSALPGEGKTTTVANLAAVMAEAGRRVLVLSLDLRNPAAHRSFDVTNGTGVSDLLAADRVRHLEEVVRETDIPGVSVATSGHDTDHPGALLASVGELVAVARSLADVVVIDTPPMLTVADALDVARHADMTLLVTRLNKTTRTQAAECHRLLNRLGISAQGTVLVGSRPAGARYGYQMAGDHARESMGDEVAPQRSDD